MIPAGIVVFLLSELWILSFLPLPTKQIPTSRARSFSTIQFPNNPSGPMSTQDLGYFTGPMTAHRWVIASNVVMAEKGRLLNDLARLRAQRRTVARANVSGTI